MRHAFFIFWIIAFAASGQAANIEIRPGENGLPDVIFVHGELFHTDADRFKAIASIPSKAVVAFASPGGSVVAGTTIGEVIRLKNFDTVVLDGDQCASACALAWLGGARRFVGQDARIGFHAAHNVQSGDVSGFGNAIVGAYLNKIGLSTQAILYITVAEPNSMLWLNLADARKFGIDVEYLAPSTESRSAARDTSPSMSPLQNEAIAFVKRHAASESASPLASVEEVRAHYAETVLYYGKHLSKEAVLKEFRTFVERWPERKYHVREDTIDAQCFPGSDACNVTAVIDWVATSLSRGKRSAGHSTWALGLVRQGGILVIASINGTVIKRQITDLRDGAVAIKTDRLDIPRD